MKLCMIGTGYVGLVSGVCFADLGNNVVCVDKDINKINSFKKTSSWFGRTCDRREMWKWSIYARL